MGRVEGNRSKGRRQGDSGGKAEGQRENPQVEAVERLSVELARLRAKFGTDPAVAGASLDDAWMSPTATMEEDEAEFIDAVADCLGAGLSLDAALTCWDRGELVSDEDDGDDGDETTEPMHASAHHPPHHGRRVVVSS